MLSNVMLGSNPNADPMHGGGWPELTGRTWDVAREATVGTSEWSLACHWKVVGPGTVGWIHRWNGKGLGNLVGLIAFDSDPEPIEESNAINGHKVKVWYCSGQLVKLREDQ
jgi:hypothetical protein